MIRIEDHEDDALREAEFADISHQNLVAFHGSWISLDNVRPENSVLFLSGLSMPPSLSSDGVLRRRVAGMLTGQSISFPELGLVGF